MKKSTAAAANSSRDCTSAREGFEEEKSKATIKQSKRKKEHAERGKRAAERMQKEGNNSTGGETLCDNNCFHDDENPNLPVSEVFLQRMLTICKSGTV